MTALFAKNSINFMARLHILLMFICASRSSREVSEQPLKPHIVDGVIILKEFKRISDGLPHVKSYLRNISSIHPEFIFELYPNFVFNTEYFNDILNIEDLQIGIRFNSELEKLVDIRKAKSSEYVNKFLEKLSHVQNLMALELTYLKLTEIPEMIYKFKNLERLDLEYNNFYNFHLDSNRLKNLKTLRFGFSENITEIDESICNLQSLQSLRISKCRMSKIPDSINKLKNLTELRILRCPIKSMSKNLSNLKNLEYLIIEDCSIEEIFMNMSDHPKLKSLYLPFNHSLKYLKLLISEIPQELKNFAITNYTLEKVEIYLNLKTPRFIAFTRKKKQPEDFDYVIKVNPSELFSSPENHKTSELKTYEYRISTNPGPNKTILIEEFNLEKPKAITKDKLIGKWNEIFKKIDLKSKVQLIEEYNLSIEFLKNLYKIKISDYSDWTNSFPFEYKEKMISMLSILFDQLEEKNLESQIKSILEILKRPHSEQLIYFNYLLKYSKRGEFEKSFLNIFIEDSFEILKDYLFTVFLNLEKYERAKPLRHPVRSFSKNENFFKSETFTKLFKDIINAAKNFESEFTVEYFSEVIANVITLIDDPKLFDVSDEMIEFLLQDLNLGPDCFVFETKVNNKIIKKLTAQGMKVLICSIVNGKIPMPDE